ncbi:unnamed protein product [Blepharisma stoltei]|uniref:Palmitoyltransferase n=1 Tax=Blepharisma stoltei TaxID=1481888 RepID=A0AAU9IF28_9CILI|nr:unnamed protein product [Blepharisma stoltei]
MRLNAQASTLCTRIFYILAHALAFTVLFYYPSDFTSNMSYPFFTFILLKLAASIQYFTCGINPGYLKDYDTSHYQQIEDDWQPPPQFTCNTCKIIIPYRSKHCKDCDLCVASFDHHCYWIGSCVGELNHFRFCLYLLSESLSLILFANNCVSGMSRDKQAYGAFIVVFAISGLMGVMTLGMGIYHIYLVSIASTTWESQKWNKITYLNIYPRSFNPFSKGIIKNWKNAIFDKRPRQWILPKPPQSTRQISFSFFDNQYYSCC